MKDDTIMHQPGIVKKIQYTAIMILFAASVFFAYSNTINSPFVLDDSHAILENHVIRMNEITLKELAGFFNSNFVSDRLLPKFSFALNYFFGQYNVKGYHLVNIIIHVINGILLFFFINITFSISAKLSYKPVIFRHNDLLNISVFSVLIWLLHPLQTNSVTYIVQRMNSMAVLFYILSLLLYAKGRNLQIEQKTLDNAHLNTNAEKEETGNNFLSTY